MAKSKSGGTRSYIRGRVGADVYSIGRDSKGKKQQVVRSLAEEVANPQTLAQMRGRMIMSTVMQAVAALRPIVDHSFDGISGKQPNISQFIALNYALIKADIAAHPSTDNKFGLVAYQQKGVLRGQYQLSDGKAAVPAALVLTQASGVVTITLDSEGVSVAGLKSKLGFNSNEFFTLVGITANATALYARLRINPSVADTTAITSANVEQMFLVEGNFTPVVSVADNVITIAAATIATCCAVIVSKESTNGFVHNKAVLGAGVSFNNASDVALLTYPVGSANYLNGGDIFGGSETTIDGSTAGSGSSSGGDGGDDGDGDPGDPPAGGGD